MRIFRRAATLAAISLVALGLAPTASADVVTHTEHVRLGFTTSQPFTFHRSDTSCLGLCSYSLDYDATATLTVDLGADITVSYDRADVQPGATVPISITYTPTNDSGNELSANVSGDLTLDFTGCLNCPATFGFTMLSANADFTAPIGGAGPVAVPISSDTITISSPFGDIASGQLSGSVTLGAVAPTSGSIAGLGGAAALLNVSDGGLSAIANPVNPPIILGDRGIAEWSAGSQTIVASIEIPSNASSPVHIDLSPVYHWLDTSANLQFVIDLQGVLGIFGDPSPISIFSGSLGPLYTAAGLDTAVSDAVEAAIGFDPGFGAAIAAGRLPVPFLDPPIASAPPFPAFGTAAFTVATDSDSDGLLDGDEIALGTDPDDPDTDDDGLLDGTEVHGTNPTDPLDPDSDDDALLDGTEDANQNGAFDSGETDPNNPDTDGDTLLDGTEDANHNGVVDPGETDPRLFDTDGDGLSDGVEVATGTDPLDSDSDDDGIPDGQDTEFLENAVNASSPSSWNSEGNRNAFLSRLAAIENRVAHGDKDQAVHELQLLRMRIDGCGATADVDDWITDCALQVTIRGYVDLLIANLS
jgi:hypothetical protein